MACRWESEAQHTHSLEQANLFSQVGQLLSEGARCHLFAACRRRELGANLLTEDGANFISFKYPGKLILVAGKGVASASQKGQLLDVLRQLLMADPHFHIYWNANELAKVLVYSWVENLQRVKSGSKTRNFNMVHLKKLLFTLTLDLHSELDFVIPCWGHTFFSKEIEY
jgi:hypothetical protein